jgi:hypothetical protein
MKFHRINMVLSKILEDFPPGFEEFEEFRRNFIEFR